MVGMCFWGKILKPFGCLCNSVIGLFLVELDFVSELIPEDRFVYSSEPKGHLARNTSNVSLCSLYVGLCTHGSLYSLFTAPLFGAGWGGTLYSCLKNNALTNYLFWHLELPQFFRSHWISCGSSSQGIWFQRYLLWPLLAWCNWKITWFDSSLYIAGEF